jgi:hypothetical protein
MEGAARCEGCKQHPPLRKYCRSCSPKASLLYKRRLRREARAAGLPYWRDWWEKAFGGEADTKRREFFRTYMRRYRRRVRRAQRARAVHP